MKQDNGTGDGGAGTVPFGGTENRPLSHIAHIRGQGNILTSLFYCFLFRQYLLSLHSIDRHHYYFPTAHANGDTLPAACV